VEKGRNWMGKMGRGIREEAGKKGRVFSHLL